MTATTTTTDINHIYFSAIDIRMKIKRKQTITDTYSYINGKKEKNARKRAKRQKPIPKWLQ